MQGLHSAPNIFVVMKLAEFCTVNAIFSTHIFSDLDFSSNFLCLLQRIIDVLMKCDLALSCFSNLRSDELFELRPAPV